MLESALFAAWGATVLIFLVAAIISILRIFTKAYASTTSTAVDSPTSPPEEPQPRPVQHYRSVQELRHLQGEPKSPFTLQMEAESRAIMQTDTRGNTPLTPPRGPSRPPTPRRGLWTWARCWLFGD